MYETKTKPTRVRVSTYINGIKDAERRNDCRVLVSLMKRVTGSRPKMWGPSIVGFGLVHYKYPSGQEGDMGEAGFSSRKPDLVIYLIEGYENPETKKLLDRLGKYKTGKVCLYVRRLADIDVHILEQLVSRSVNLVRNLYPSLKK